MILSTVVNACAIVAGGAVGLLIAKAGGNRLGSGKMAESVQKILGLAIVALGMRWFLKSTLFCRLLSAFP